MDGVDTCFNSRWESGVSSSLAAGLRSLGEGGGIDGVLVTLTDQPRVTAEQLASLLAEFQNGPHRLVAALYNGVIGVPAVFGREFFRDLESLKGDSGAGAWLRAHSKVVRAIPVPSAAFDVDTPTDVSELTAET